jgi:glutaryl-CoA dehydrogenase
MGCFGLTEPDHGSNPGGMTTNIKDDQGDHYLLNGAKMWISNSPGGDKWRWCGPKTKKAASAA